MITRRHLLTTTNLTTVLPQDRSSANKHTTAIQEKLSSPISVRNFGAIGDGITDDRIAIQSAIDYASEKQTILIFPSGTYMVDAFQHGPALLGKSNVIVIFNAGSRIILRNLKHYRCSALLDHFSQSNISYINVTLDAGNYSGANVFGASDTSRLTISGGLFTNGKRHPTRGGGRGITFQFDCQHIKVNDATIINCTTGLDFHGRFNRQLRGVIAANISIENCEEAISFYNLFDNDDTSIRGDVQVLVRGVSIVNCGRATEALTSKKSHTTGTEGGIIVSERAGSFFVDGASIYNDITYGKIGGIFRGSGSHYQISNIIARADVFSIINFSPAENLTPVKGLYKFQTKLPRFHNISFDGSCDYVAYCTTTTPEGAQFLDIKCPLPNVKAVNKLMSTDNNFLRLLLGENNINFCGTSEDLYYSKEHSNTINQ